MKGKDTMPNEIEATYGYLYNFAIVPRRKMLREFQQYKEIIGKILRQLCGYQRVKVHKFNVADDHIQFLVELPKNLFRGDFITELQKLSTMNIKKRYPDVFCTLKCFWYAECWWRSYLPGTDKRNEREIRGFINKKMRKKKRGCTQNNNNQGGN